MAWTWFPLPRKHKVAKTNGRVFRPVLEALEDRTVPTSLSFVLDPTQSSLSVTGTGLGATLQAQGPGSLTTTYSGTIGALYDSGAGTLQFTTAGTNVVAANSGSWAPAIGGGSGTDLANYGGTFTVLIFNAQVALRNLAVSINSSAYTLGAGGTFNSTETLATTAGTVDYNAGALGMGTSSVANQSTTNQATAQGTFQDMGGGTYQITVPIDFTITQTVQGQPVMVRAQGTVVGTAHAVQAAPVVVLSNGATTYAATFTAGGPAVNVADPASATVTDAGTSNLTGLAVTLTNNPDGPAESLAVDPGALAASGLSASYSYTTGTLTITGTASLATYQSLLQTVTYVDTSAAPDPSLRTITFVAQDDQGQVSQPSTATVTIATAAAPVINLGGSSTTNNYATTFTSGGPAVNVADPNNSTITDAASSNLTQLVITLTNNNDGANELLAVDPNVLAASGLSATYDPTSATLTISGNGSLATYLSLLQSVTYCNSAVGDTTPRLITFVATDDMGNVSQTSTTTLTLM